MKIVKTLTYRSVTILSFLILIINPAGIINAQQKISIGIHADPAISWFSSDVNKIQNDGAIAGFSFGLTFNKYFTPNYAFSTGINVINAGGRLVSKDTTKFELTDPTPVTVLPGKPVGYRIQYLAIPIGLKLKTNQIGYLTFFSDLGLDPKIVIGGKADIPSLNIKGENAMNELNIFNLSYHITAGIEYSLGGSTAMLLGLNFDNNFLDITKDNGVQPTDKISHKILSFRIGVNF
ncbi:MAG: porin family protein [Bacteroidia bacterium]|nr:porin family protein [Bacteroidia bacterium]